ncbi:MAG: hypothetical protein ACLQIB_37305 [Isosphaeraceae bacterium]
MNDARREILERLFDGEPVAGDPRDAADDAESLAYLQRLSLLRELARRHDPAAALPARQPAFVPPRSRRRILATLLAVAASVLFAALVLRNGSRAKLERASIPSEPPPSCAHDEGAVTAPARPRSPRPTLEVELYRWANESSPYPDDAAGVVLSRVGSLRGRHASREILALELANATPGSAIKIPRSEASPATATPGLIRKPGSSRRHRFSSSPRA